ncbi:MAG: type 4a pilus biogenesis protein PilO [Candidatus Glassbacteria bacterium]|nr:type 4a pilus biogenesis protein PilO [Candidatus Glassbacteria bacterium]
MAIDTSDPKIQKSLFVMLVVIGLGYLYYAYMYGPKVEEITKALSELKKVESELDEARAFVESSDTAFLRVQLDRTSQELDLIKSLLPTSENLAELLEQVTHVADRTGVKSALFEPSAPVQHEIYQERPYKVTLRGGFHETAMFLSEVASLPRIIKPSGLSMVRKARKGPEEEELLTAQMVLTTYLLVEKPPETKQEVKKKSAKKKRK